MQNTTQPIANATPANATAPAARTANAARAIRRQIALLGGGLALIAALTFSAIAYAEQSAKPSVTVKTDDKPITRTAPSTTDSYAPIIKQVAPSVVKVLVTERAKNVPIAGMQGNPFFNDPRFRQFFGPYLGGGDDDDSDDDTGNLPPQRNQNPQRGRRGGAGNGGADRNDNAPRGYRGPTMRIPEQTGLGSGVIVSTDGYVLTNAHVVDGADIITVTLNDGRELKAKVVGADPKTDLAVIKIDAKDLPAVTFANSDQLEVGDRVLAIGNPFGVGQTVTTGIISGLGRGDIGILADVQGYEDFIQIDASINPGNSGGALTDVRGRLIGINSAILSRTGGFQGIGLAIPANLARTVMEQLVATGKVTRGYLGVGWQPLTPALAEQFDAKDTNGVLINEIADDSPASKAGLQTGDIITDFNNKPVKDGNALRLTVANAAPDTTVPLTVLRDGAPKTLTITVGNIPGERASKNKNASGKDDADKDTGTLNGVAVSDLADLDPRLRRQLAIPQNITGAIVTDLDPDSPAASAGLRRGDIIQEINRQPVKNADDAIKLTENPSSRKTRLKLWNQGRVRYVVVDETDTAPASAAESSSGK